MTRSTRDKYFPGRGRTTTETTTEGISVDPVNRNDAGNGRTSSRHVNQSMFNNSSGVNAMGGNFSNVAEDWPYTARNPGSNPTKAVLNQSMFTDARDVDARYGTFSNVGHSQTNNYHGTGDPYTYGSEGSFSDQRRSASSHNDAYSHTNSTRMDANSRLVHSQAIRARGVDVSNGNFANVGRSQPDTYYDANSPRTYYGSEGKSSSNGRQSASTRNDAYSYPNPEEEDTNSEPSPDDIEQSMFSNSRNVDARYGRFSNVGGSQSNNYHGADKRYR